MGDVVKSWLRFRLPECLRGGGILSEPVGVPELGRNCDDVVGREPARKELVDVKLITNVTNVAAVYRFVLSIRKELQTGSCAS